MSKFKQSFPLIFTYSVLLGTILFNFYNIFSFPKVEKVIASSYNSSKVQSEEYWLRFTSEHPTYMPGWLRLSELYIKNNELEKASRSLMVAETLNPNSEELLIIQKKLVNLNN